MAHKRFIIPHTSGNSLWIGAGEPAIGMKTGDALVDTTANAYKVYTGSAWAGGSVLDGAVTVAKIGANALAASTAGRGKMQTGFFDEATVNDKFATDSFGNAELVKIIKDGAFNADAPTRALFEDGIWTLAKHAATANYRILNYRIEDLAAGADFTARAIFIAPTGLDVTLISAGIIPEGASEGVDDSNTAVIALTDGTNSIVSKTYNTAVQPPAANAFGDLGALNSTYKVLSAGEKLCLAITQGATADLPGLMLQVVYSVADAA